MTAPTLAASRQTVTIQVAAERVDVSQWLFGLRDDEYRRCSPAHLAAGMSRSPDGRRMAINVERPGDTLLVQHYVEEIATRSRCRVVSDTDALTAAGPTRYQVIWEVSVAPAGPGSCHFTNQVMVYPTADSLQRLDAAGVSLTAASRAAQRALDEHNAEETPLFARDIEAKARAGLWPATDSP